MVLPFVAAAVDVEIEAVEMHWMHGVAGIDDTHPNRLAHAIREPFGMTAMTVH